MNDLLQDLTSFRWWFGVVLVGLVVNLASAYLKGPVDSALGSWSKWWADRSLQTKNRRDTVVRELSADKHLQLIYLAAEARARSRALYLLVASLGFLIVGLSIKASTTVMAAQDFGEPLWWFRKLLGAVAVLGAFLSMHHIFAAGRMSQLVADALKWRPEREA